MSEENDYEKNWEIEEYEDDTAVGNNGEDDGDGDEYEGEEYTEDGDDYDLDTDDDNGIDLPPGDDDDDIDPPPEDDDNDDYTQADPRGQPADYYQPEYTYEDDQESGQPGFQDEPEKRENKREATHRGRVLACFLCCCCLILIAVGLILAFVLEKDSNPAESSGSSDSPSIPKPTLAPQEAFPTESPTISPAPTVVPVPDPTVPPTKYPTAEPTTTPAPTKEVPDEFSIIPFEDTYIVDAFDKFEEHGDEDVFLVQNSVDHVNEIPDSFALLNFDLSEVPFDRIQNRTLSAVLELTHKPFVLERGPATYTIERLPSIRLAVESLHYGTFPLPENGIRGPDFDVDPSDESITVDVTALIFGGLYQPSDDDTALLMIVNYGVEQQKGDEFKSRESVGSEPKLRLSLIEIPGVPESTASPDRNETSAPTTAESEGSSEGSATNTTA